MVILSLIFWGNFTLFSIVVIPIYFLTNSAKEFSFLHILANICCLFLLMAILTMWGSTVVWIGFPWWLLFLHIFSYILWPFVCLLGKSWFVSSAHFLIGFGGFCYWMIWVHYILQIVAPYQIYSFQIFSLILWLRLHCIHYFFCCVGF